VNAQDWINQNLAIILPIYFATLWTGISFLIAKAGGWALLAARFRLNSTFVGEKWSMQSAAMRFGVSYNNCLTVGANNVGLFVQPMILFRLWHPPLFVPWSEIRVSPKRKLLWDFMEYRLGREEEIPFTVRPKLARKIQAAAAQTGAAMPIE
jgi:hypothetical protein